MKNTTNQTGTTKTGIYEYRLDAPGRPEDGRIVRFDARTGPKMFARVPFQLADGSMAHMNFVGPVEEVQS